MTVGFPAAYAGRCGNCGEIFGADTQVFYADDILMVVECCGEQDDPPQEVVSRYTPKVMPRGKTVRDRCDGCFQVPASNGTCGCS